MHDPEDEIQDKVSLLFSLIGQFVHTNGHRQARGYIGLAFGRASQGIHPEFDVDQTFISYIDVKVAQFEMLFIRLLHLLAHHPDFGTDESQLREQTK